MIAQPQQAQPHRQPVPRPPCIPHRQPGQGRQRSPSLPTISRIRWRTSGVTSSRGRRARTWRVKAWSFTRRRSWFWRTGEPSS
ncbi:hypothetical protein PU71_13780 [Escherichia coli]|nr:hypothetical protein PU71_13780 [Escherichia coli]KPO48519.1 hypothetical protein ACU90_19885 [Escherichia coli]